MKNRIKDKHGLPVLLSNSSPSKAHRRRKGPFHLLANQQNVYRTQVELIKERESGEAFFGRVHACVELVESRISCGSIKVALQIGSGLP
jgi:hypothetical protein